MRFSELREYDDIEITGFATSPIQQFTNFKGTVGCVSCPDPYDTIHPDDWYIKVWPDAEQEECSGKIWFCESQVESVRLIHRWEDEDVTG